MSVCCIDVRLLEVSGAWRDNVLDAERTPPPAQPTQRETTAGLGLCSGCDDA